VRLVQDQVRQVRIEKQLQATLYWESLIDTACESAEASQGFGHGHAAAVVM
jgi:hypothetical protein